MDVQDMTTYLEKYCLNTTQNLSLQMVNTPANKSGGCHPTLLIQQDCYFITTKMVCQQILAKDGYIICTGI